MKNTIFYFTGTGNSLQIAKLIATNLQDCKIVSISKNIKSINTLQLDGRVGFVFPVYYCGLPEIVREFLSNITLTNTDYTYMIATYGKTGGNAGCLSQAQKLLTQNGAKLNASFYVKTVDNFILWSWDIPPKEKHSAIYAEVKKKVSKIIYVIRNEQSYSDKSIMEYIGPILFRYNHFVENVTTNDKSFFATSNCVACGLCEKVCPTQNLVINENRPTWKSEKCQRCLACLHLCPKKAIEYGRATKKKSRYKNPYISISELTYHK